MDAHTALDVALTIAGCLSAMWLRAVRQDIHDLVKQVANHGERIAVLESKVNDLKGGK